MLLFAVIICIRLFGFLKPIVDWHLEAAAVGLYLYSCFISPTIGFMVLTFALYSPFFPICGIELFMVSFSIFAWIYIFWFIYDFRTPEQRTQFTHDARKWKLYEYLANYFPIELIKTAELSPQHNYIIGAHPHGILCFGAFTALSTDAVGFDRLFPGIDCVVATIRTMFWLPIKRDETLFMTRLIAVSERGISNFLSQKNCGLAVGIVVGGAEEMLDAHCNSHKLCLANRKGFVRLAIQNGAHLVPMYCFGENNVYSQIPNAPGSMIRRIQAVIKKCIGFSPTLISGRGLYFPYFGFMPRRTKITCVVGRPIEVTRNDKPSDDQVNQLHARYCNQLMELFEEFKLKCGAQPTNQIIFY